MTVNSLARVAVVAMATGVALTMPFVPGTTNAANVKPQAERPWMNTSLGADERANLVLGQMSQDEKLRLVFGYFGTSAVWQHNYVPPKGALEGSAGFVPGLRALAFPI